MIAYQPTSWSLEVVCYATKTKYPAWIYYYARSTYITMEVWVMNVMVGGGSAGCPS